jgi:hypothetical protein
MAEKEDWADLKPGDPLPDNLSQELVKALAPRIAAFFRKRGLIVDDFDGGIVNIPASHPRAPCPRRRG